MSPTIGLPPPPAEAILDGSRESRYKGGTLIAEEVSELSEHLIRLANADLYRPARCARCGHDRLHVHDRPERHPRGDRSLPAVIEVLVFCCASPACGATWRILPRFLARHLWYTWQVVESIVKPSAASKVEVAAVPVSARTVQRWHWRLSSSGRMLVVLLAMAGGLLAEVALQCGLSCPREDVLDAFVIAVAPAVGLRLSALAAVLHRLERGIRLM
jgi:hypothetical protein